MTVVQFAFYFGTARAERASENSNLLLAMLAVILALPLDRAACRFSGGSHISEFFTRARARQFLTVLFERDENTYCAAELIDEIELPFAAARWRVRVSLVAGTARDLVSCSRRCVCARPYRPVKTA